MKLSHRARLAVPAFIIVQALLMMFPDVLLGQWEPDRKLSSIDTIAALNENQGHCIVAGGDTVHVVWYDAQNNGSAVLYKRSLDGGTTWGGDTRLTTTPSVANMPLLAVSGSTLHVAYRDSGSGHYASSYRRSLDGGNTWGPDFSLDGDTPWWPGVAAEGNTVFVSLNEDNSEVYFRRSTDNGASWEAKQQISNATGRSEDPSIAAGSGFVHVAWNDTRTGVMHTYYRRSSDQGVTWGPETPLNSTNTYSPHVSVFGSFVDVLWADRRSGDFDIYLRESSDFGSTWGQEKQLSADAATSLYPVIARDGSNVHIVWWNLSGDIAYRHSGDGGTTWDPAISLVGAASQPSKPFIAIAGPAVHVIWTDRRDGHPAIYYKRNPTGNSPTTGVVSARPDDRPASFTLSAFPNPFNPTTTIEFSIPEDGKVTLGVYDLLGREVAVLLEGERKAGNVTPVVFDASGLSSGVYLCRLEAGSHSLIKTLLVLK